MAKHREMTVQKDGINSAVELHLQSIGRQLWLAMEPFDYDSAYIFAQPERGVNSVSIFRKQGSTLTYHKAEFLLADAFIDLWEDWPDDIEGTMWFACELALARDGAFSMQLFYREKEEKEESIAATRQEWLDENFGDQVKVIYPEE